MKKCNKEGCEEQIDEKYTYCYAHYQPGRVTAPVTPKGVAWHDDPVVDALLKCNSNLGKIASVLEKINEQLGTIQK